MESENAGTIGGYTRAIASVLQSRGLNSHEIFKKAGVKSTGSIDPMQRITSAQAGKVFALAREATGDHYLGLAAGEAVQPGLMHALGYGLLSSVTLSDFFQRTEKYWRVASDAAEFKHSVEEKVEVLSAQNILPQVCSEDIDAWMVTMLRLIRTVYQREINPVFVEIPHDCPPTGDVPYAEFFKCELRFNSEQARIAINRDVMRERLPAASEELAMHNDGIVMEYLEKLEKADIKTRVYKQLVQNLSAGNISIEAVSERLNMSVRNIQLKLAAEGTSFQELLESCRKDLAMSYIQQSRKSITEIAFMLGFADASNFTRAFRRWTGMSPREYRSQQSA